jgi:hypothetical protein
MLLSLLFACTAPNDSGGTCASGDTLVAVADYVYFAKRDDDNVTQGFDLDDAVTATGDPTGCGREDMTGTDGSPGVDSALSGLVPALEATQASAVEGLIQDSISAGELLLLTELTGVDDWENDDCVDFGLHRGEGVPLVGTDARVLDNQSFGRLDSSEPGVVLGTSIEDGVMTARGFEFDLPLQILDVTLDLHLYNAGVQLELAEDGSATGFVAGAIPLEDIMVLTELGDIGEVGPLLEQLLPLAADLDPDQTGECQSLSAVLEFTATPAHFYEE